MSTALEHAHTPVADHRSGRAGAVRRFVGGFYLFTAGVNAGMALADPEVYREFASEAFFSFVTNAWQDVVMSHPVPWFAALAAGELVLGLLLLRGGLAARVGWAGVLAFQVLLMLFGFGFWMWSLPVLAVLVPVVWRDWPRLQQER
jgi:hypothetical protein